jgi:hypothetical protein
MFNEIIGYIRLHFFDRQIAGEYYVVNAERIVRTRQKTFVYETHNELAEVIDIPDDSSSREIYMLIREYLGGCAKEVKGRYIDKTIFDRIGPFVDRKALLES